MIGVRERVPLTPSQAGLWFGEQWERSPQKDGQAAASAAMYHINASLRVCGELDPGALHDGLVALLDRHPILRSRLVALDEPSLEDTGPVVLAMPAVDFSRSPHTAFEMTQARLAQEVGRSFDLSRGPLVRAALLRVAEDDHVLVLVVHHLVCDGLSLRVLYRDLGLLYQRLSGGEVDLPAPASWFARDLTPAADRDRALEYWQNMLRDARPMVDLPADRPRSEGGGSAGNALRYPVPPELWKRLLTACADWRVTPYMAVFAAYAVLLARLTGQRDLVIGSPTSGRLSMDDGDTVGMFVTTTPLRVRIGATDTTRELLDQVRTRVLEAMQFGGIGLEELVDRLQVPRSTVYAPIVQTLCGLDQLDVLAPELGPDTRAERIATPCTRAKFELSLGVEVAADGVVTDWEYRTDLFAGSTIDALADAYLALLESFVDEEGEPVLHLAAGGAASLLAGPARTDAVVLPTDVPVPLQIAAQAALTPDAIAMRTSSGVELRYDQFDAMARGLAARARAAGVGPEDTVLLAMPRGVSWAVAVLGSWYSGAAIVPLDLSLPDARLRAMVEQVGARLGVAETPEAGKVVSARLGVGVAWLDLVGLDDETATAEPATVPGSLAYVMFTSGSTGKPKPVAIGHDAVAYHASIIAERFELTPDDVCLQFAALSFDVSFEETLPVWCVGGTALLLEDNAIAPAELEHVLSEGGGTLVDLPSSYWAEWTRDLERRPRELPAGLRLVVIGSEAGYVTDLERWQARTDIAVVNAYGQTETTITSLTHLCSERDGRFGSVLPIGATLRGMRAYALDSAMQPVAPNLVGELYLAGPCLGRGYLGLPAVTAQRFLPDPFTTEAGARMYCTGDRVRLDPDGALRFLGRADDQVKVRGHRVELSEIEAVIATYPQVGEVVARSVRTDGSYEIIAYMVAKAEQPELDVDGLRRFLVERVPSYQVPAQLIALPELPRTAGGKLVPSSLPEPVRTGPVAEMAAEGVMRADGPEEVLLRIWAEVVGRADISVDENFFAVGGDSILSIRVVSLARAAGMRLTARDIFQYQTVRNLAAAVGEQWTPGTAVEVPAAAPATVTVKAFHLPATDHLGIDGASRSALLADALDAERIELAGPMQRWGLNQLRHRPRPGLYRVYEAFDLSGADVDVDQLVLAWNALVEHHPTLRTSLCAHDGQDLQVVHRNARLQVYRKDLSSLRTTDAVQAFSEHLDTIKATPADPLRHCQVELTVFDRGTGGAYLAWDFSYLNLDGWSFPMLFKDLLDLHDGFRADMPVSLPARPSPGVIARWWQARDQDAARSFWTEKLAGTPQGLVSAGLGPGSDDGSKVYVDQRTWLPAERTDELNRQAAKAGLTLHTLVQGAYAIALGHALDTDDLVFGTVVSGRADAIAGAEDIVGCLNNRLPSRVRVARMATCGDWLRSVQDAHAEAGSFEHVSPLDIQRWCGIPDENRLYDSEIVVENFPFDGRLQSRIADWNPLANGARGDETLRLTVWPDPALLLKASYYRDMVDDARVVDLLYRVKLVLDEFAGGLHRPVVDLLKTVRGGVTETGRREACSHSQIVRSQPRTSG